MSVTTREPAAETAVRDLIERWINASIVGDLDAIMGCYASHLRVFDAIGPLQFTDAASYREHWRMCLSFMVGDMTFEAHDLRVHTDGDIAFAHYLVRCGGTDQQGETQTGWMRGTTCCRRVDGEWKIAHEHFSAPFDPESGRTLLDLVPPGREESP
ncbi:nuclear transport factor 2 family protein [Aquisalimonas sp.]|uniref:YybH family protein n=1 Tax=Aquisalimonas sp. TaxID=1872621 RepID=UPI0025BEAE27|nr:nuclear transport factor 2 family protein [Aquisalimonas sp.]